MAKSLQSPLEGVLWFMDAILDTVEAAAEAAVQSAPPNVVATVRFAFAASADFVPGAGPTVNIAQFLVEVYRNYRKKVGSPVSKVFRRQMEALAGFGDRSTELVHEFDRRFARLQNGKVACDVADVRKYIASVPLFVKSRTEQATAEVERLGRHAWIFSAEKLGDFLPPELLRLQSGALVLGPNGLKIEVAQPIAVGGFGEVWECEANGLTGYAGRHLALKYCRTDGHRPVMERDAQILRQLSVNGSTTACVPRLVVDGTAESVPWILMELVEGAKTLRKWTVDLVGQGSGGSDTESKSYGDTAGTDKTLPILMLLEMAHRVAAVLVLVHGANVVHGDLKPDNVLIGADGGVRLADFGSSRLDTQEQQSLTQAGMRAGTWAYMPQRYLGTAEISPRLDVYAFGVILVEMMLGHADLVRHERRLRDARVPDDVINLIDDMLDVDKKLELPASVVLTRIEHTRIWRMRQFNLRMEALKIAGRTVMEAASDKYSGRTAHLSIGRESVRTLAVNLAPLALLATGLGSFVVHVEGRKADHAVEAKCSSGDVDACRVAATCRRTGDCSLSVDGLAAERFEARVAFELCEQGSLPGCRVVIGCHSSGACLDQHNAPPLEYAKILACRAGAEEFCEAKEPATAPDAGAPATSPTPSQAAGMAAVASPAPGPAVRAGDTIRQPTTAPAAPPPAAARPDVATVPTEKRKLPSAAGERQKRTALSGVQFEKLHSCTGDVNDVDSWQSFAAICAKLHNATGDHMIDVRVSVPTRVDGEPVVSVWGEDGVGGEAVDCLKSRILASGHALKLAPGCLVKLKLHLVGN